MCYKRYLLRNNSNITTNKYLMKITHCIGLMSGTSLDGVDLVYTAIESGDNYSYKILKAKTYSYSKEWLTKLKNAFNQSASDLEELHRVYGKYLGKLVLQFQNEFQIEKLDFIASHGHTIFHKPEEKYTLQIGCGKEIYKLTNTQVVYDFRSQDVAMGGQGAPLVPIGDQLLFSEYDYCLNLGGFANISYDDNGIRKAFDICPVNIVMNHYIQPLGYAFDDKGQMAASGKICKPLLKKLNGLKFYSFSYPKSLGYEFVVEEVFPVVDAFEIDISDLLRTFIEHIAVQISNVLARSSNIKLLITGGGAYNDFLIHRIRNLTMVQVEIPSNTVIEYKEALVFSLLGLLRLEGNVNCLKSVTGASKNHSSGCVAISIDF